MEFIFNDQLGRLELLRIIHLDSLSLKGSTGAALFASPEQTGRSSGQKRQAQVPAAQKQNEQTGENAAPQEISTDGKYICFLEGNVVIETPQQTVFADKVSICNISSEKNTNSDGAAHRPRPDTQTPAGRVDSNKPPEPSQNVVVTCDSGVIVVPMGSQEGFKNVADDNNVKITLPANNAAKSQKTTLIARDIEYQAATGDTIAAGPVTLTFYANDIIDTGPNKIVPVKVTAQKQAKFSASDRQVVFEGDCVCEMTRSEPNMQLQYTLSAPQITVNISADVNSPAQISRLIAAGPVVQLAAARRTAQQILGFTKLKCRRIDFDTSRQLFSAKDGLIAMDNSKAPVVQKKPAGRFSLQRPSYAFLRDFDTLVYSFSTNRILADAAPNSTLQIDYIPVGEGADSRLIKATAGHIEAALEKTANGRIELSTLKASGLVSYDQQQSSQNLKNSKNRALQFVGTDFLFDARNSLITAQGTQSQPCMLNGAVVDGIEYNLGTDRLKVKVAAPGSFR